VKRGDYRITLDRAFADVVRGLPEDEAPASTGHVDPRARGELPRAARARVPAHSVEAWLDERLVGGLFGVSIGRFFSGDSMFALEPDASKVAFVWFARQLRAWDFGLIDCQVYTAHLERFGAKSMPAQRVHRARHEARRAEGRAVGGSSTRGLDRCDSAQPRRASIERADALRTVRIQRSVVPYGHGT
jgi:leucyl/phenylalanyl-tRNA--protein transferase